MVKSSFFLSLVSLSISRSLRFWTFWFLLLLFISFLFIRPAIVISTFLILIIWHSTFYSVKSVLQNSTLLVRAFWGLGIFFVFGIRSFFHSAYWNFDLFWFLSYDFRSFVSLVGIRIKYFAHSAVVWLSKHSDFFVSTKKVWWIKGPLFALFVIRPFWFRPCWFWSYDFRPFIWIFSHLKYFSIFWDSNSHFDQLVDLHLSFIRFFVHSSDIFDLVRLFIRFVVHSSNFKICRFYGLLKFWS